MPSFIITALFSLLAHAPSIVDDIQAAVKEHWGKDHVQQALKGLDVLQQVVKDAAPIVSDVTAAVKQG